MLAQELGFRRWISKVTERLTFIELKVKNKEIKELTEGEESLWQALHRVWANGDYPIYFYENDFVKTAETSQEQGLFDSEESDGTKIDPSIETKEEEK